MYMITQTLYNFSMVWLKKVIKLIWEFKRELEIVCGTEVWLCGGFIASLSKQ